jgi:hypothetical protein
MDLKDYLERRSEKIPECGCWIWLGATNDDGKAWTHIGDGNGTSH